MQMQKMGLLAAFVFALSINAAAAIPKFAEPMSPMLDSLGANIDVSTQGSVVVLNLTIDREKTIESIPLLQSAGVMNGDMDQGYINLHQNVLSVGVAMDTATMAVMNLYKGTQADVCHFNVYLSVADDYGHKHKELLFLFRFDRATFKRIDWENFDMTKLQNVAPGFKFSSWVAQHGFDE